MDPTHCESKGSDHGRLSHLVESSHLRNDWGHCDLYSGGVDLSRTSLGQQRSVMLLRDHPLMCYQGIPNWPPVWSWTRGGENKYPKGEVGILKTVKLSKIPPVNRFFLEIDYEGSSYISCLFFDDPAFCTRIAKLLRDYCNRPIAEISIDPSHTL